MRLTMSIQRVQELYEKERQYQRSVFGDYKNHPHFNVATFLEFIRRYLDEASESYVDVWTKDMPQWLEDCREYENYEPAPVKTYEALIKIFTLAGAALESFTCVNVEKWREEGPKPKWEEESG